MILRLAFVYLFISTINMVNIIQLIFNWNEASFVNLQWLSIIFHILLVLVLAEYIFLILEGKTSAVGFLISDIQGFLKTGLGVRLIFTVVICFVILFSILAWFSENWFIFWLSLAVSSLLLFLLMFLIKPFIGWYLNILSIKTKGSGSNPNPITWIRKK